jgi:hypothetical protein
MIVYKYGTAERIDVLRNRRLRFTQADALNDPFEINPCLSEFNKGSIEYAKSIVADYIPTQLEMDVFARNQAKGFRERLLMDYLMLCLSKEITTR